MQFYDPEMIGKDRPVIIKFTPPPARQELARQKRKQNMQIKAVVNLIEHQIQARRDVRVRRGCLTRTGKMLSEENVLQREAPPPLGRPEKFSGSLVLGTTAGLQRTSDRT